VNASILLGATPREDRGCEFLVWAPHADSVAVRLVAPAEGLFPLARGERGYFHGMLSRAGPGSLYYYVLDDNKERPDPASRSQPHGVHGPSQVVAPDFPREDGPWPGLFLPHYVIYELHTGTFTAEGTFDALIPRLDALKELGVTAVELMPVAQFPGNRNWGYDGTYPFAVQNSYGGPEGLKRLVNACHRLGLAVVLDVVYNHLGPEGNYLGDFGPYFTDRYRTPWGPALNFDGPCSDEVRRYFVENALYWVRDCHIDALRLDALHAIFDRSPRPFLVDLAEAVHREAARLGRPVYLVAESDLNDVRLIRPRDVGGYELDAHWNDDFHHALHALLTGERAGYYEDFGLLRQLGKAYREGFVYSGEYSPYRHRRHGSSSRGIPPERFVVFAQNHDQVGNRFAGERLTHLVSFEALKLGAGAVILSPFIPLLFMGEEYGEEAPFLYFVSHSDPGLIEAVRKGREAEFAAFGGQGEPPDPQAEETFLSSRLDLDLARQGNHRILRAFYRELLSLRKRCVTLSRVEEILVYEKEGLLLARLGSEALEVIALFNFSRTETTGSLTWPPGTWLKELDSADRCWGGEGGRVPPVIRGAESTVVALAALSFALFVHRKDVR
jgi:maltooligosyltrehalose trehalohydrolase